MLVPGVGFEPTSPRFRRGAFTRLAFQALSKIGADGGNRTHTPWVAPRDSAVEPRPRRLVGRDGIEPPQQMRGVYSALGSPMPSLPSELEEGEGVRTLDREVGPAFEAGCVPPRATFPTDVKLDVPARFERATPAFEARCSRPLSYGTEFDRARASAWYAQEDSNLQPRSCPELTTGISRPLCRLSYGRIRAAQSRAEWSGWLDSNQRPPASKAGTLGQAELHPVELTAAPIVTAPCHSL